MGFLKDLGKGIGSVAGVVVGAPVAAVGELVDSDFLKDIGKGAYNATKRTGEVLGSIVEGTADVVSGAVNSDSCKRSEGYDKIFTTTGEYIESIGRGICSLAGAGVDTVGAIVDGDTDRALKTGKELAKVAAVSVLSIGVVDAVDAVDGLDVITDDEYDLVENPETHHVDPYYRTLPDGRVILVDGDGDSSIDTGNGWEQSNPDFRIKK